MINVVYHSPRVCPASRGVSSRPQGCSKTHPNPSAEVSSYMSGLASRGCTWPDMAWSCLTWYCLTWPWWTSSCLIWSCFTRSWLIWCCLTQSCLIWPNLTRSRHTSLSYPMSCVTWFNPKLAQLTSPSLTWCSPRSGVTCACCILKKLTTKSASL